MKEVSRESSLSEVPETLPPDCDAGSKTCSRQCSWWNGEKDGRSPGTSETSESRSVDARSEVSA